MEKKNFLAAAHTLSEVWSNAIIDNHKVDCAAVPIGKEFVPDDPNPSWVANHVQQARYSLQIVKCTNPSCCESFATNWLDVFPERFLPPPAVYEYTAKGIRAVEPSEYFKDPKKFTFADLEKRLVVKELPAKAKEFKQCPLDLYCPSMEEKLKKCICKTCGSYWPSEAAKNRHKKCHSKKGSAACRVDDAAVQNDQEDDIMEDDMMEDDIIEDDNDSTSSASHTIAMSSDIVESEPNCMPIIRNLAECLNSSFLQESE